MSDFGDFGDFGDDPPPPPRNRPPTREAQAARSAPARDDGPPADDPRFQDDPPAGASSAPPRSAARAQDTTAAETVEGGNGADARIMREAVKRVPAHDLDAEAAVLSVVLLRGEEGLDVVSPFVTTEDFYSEAHRRIFEAATELRSKGLAIDVVSVAALLKDTQRLSQIGGMPYLGEVMNGSPAFTDAHVQGYAKRVRDRSRLRRLALVMAKAYSQIHTSVPEGSVAEFFESVEKSVAEICDEKTAKGLRHIAPIMSAAYKKLYDVATGKTVTAGISTGFRDIDKKTGGMFEGDLIVVGARPGMGKTSYVLGLVDNVSSRGYATEIFSLEMPEEQLAQRLAAARAGLNMLKVRQGDMKGYELAAFHEAGQQLSAMEMYIDDSPGISLVALAAKARRKAAECVKRGKKLGLIVIDYLQLMKMRNPDRMPQSIGEITGGLKSLAKELSCPIVVLSQLNRSVETRSDKRPQISDLRESGNIEQDADTIIFLYRDEYYDDDSEDVGVLEANIAKQRNGPTGAVKLHFEKTTTKISNLAYTGDYEDE